MRLEVFCNPLKTFAYCFVHYLGHGQDTPAIGHSLIYYEVWPITLYVRVKILLFSFLTSIIFSHIYEVIASLKGVQIKVHTLC